MIAPPTPSGILATLTPSGILAPPTPSGMIATPTPSGILATSTPLGILATLTPSGTTATTLNPHPQVPPQQSTTIISTITLETDVSSYYSRGQRRHHPPLKCRTTTSLKECKAHQVHTSLLTECGAEPMRPRWRRTQVAS